MDEHEGLRYLYFDVAHALRTQAWIIEHSGGLGGVKNVEHLESVLGHIQNDWYYPEMADKLTHLVYSVNKNHPFNDGNKRSSIGWARTFWNSTATTMWSSGLCWKWKTSPCTWRAMWWARICCGRSSRRCCTRRTIPKTSSWR
ncbi:fic/DOC family protein [Acidovorax sp. RAC01]|nr:fic/DOC family protein [Acidovorax sp. RAC01]